MDLLAYFNQIENAIRLTGVGWFPKRDRIKLWGTFVPPMNLPRLERLRDVVILGYTAEGECHFGVKMYWKPRGMLQIFANGDFVLYGYEEEVYHYRILLLDIGKTLEDVQYREEINLDSLALQDGT
ncbi:unnamed protein product [Sphagnum tenellum]